MAQVAATVFTVFTIGLALFQAALAAGMPLGHFAWGGEHERLPTRLRISSLVVIPVYAFLALIVLDKAGLTAIFGGAGWIGPANWVVAVLCGLGVVPNAMSRSRAERFTMTPVSAVLFVSALTVALAG